eukprot:4476022-Lingulodinium_polyedra.AAC.1
MVRREESNHGRTTFDFGDHGPAGRANAHAAHPGHAIWGYHWHRHTPQSSNPRKWRVRCGS